MEWEERLPVNAAGAIPRAHRFLAVESTSDVEQPSPFAGRRSVGALRSVRILERALQPCIRAPIDDRRCSEGARGRDHDSVRPLRRRHRGDLRSSLRPAWCPRRPPQEGRAPVSQEPVRHRAARSFVRRSREGSRARERRAAPVPAREGRHARERARASLFESLLQKSLGRAFGPHGLLALSARRRTGPSSDRADFLREAVERLVERPAGQRESAIGQGRSGTGSWSANEYFAVHRARETARGHPQGFGTTARRDGWFVGGCSCWHPRARHAGVSPRDEEEAPNEGRRPGSSQPLGFHDRAGTTGSACTRSIVARAKARPGRHVKATGTSEVGPHRAPRANSPTASWKDPLKRAVRRENGVSLGTHRVGKPHRCEAIESELGRGGVTSPRTVEHGYTMSKWLDGRCWWSASRVCEGPRGPSRR